MIRCNHNMHQFGFLLLRHTFTVSQATTNRSNFGIYGIVIHLSNALKLLLHNTCKKGSKSPFSFALSLVSKIGLKSFTVSRGNQRRIGRRDARSNRQLCRLATRR